MACYCRARRAGGALCVFSYHTAPTDEAVLFGAELKNAGREEVLRVGGH